MHVRDEYSPKLVWSSRSSDNINEYAGFPRKPYVLLKLKDKITLFHAALQIFYRGLDLQALCA